MTEYANHLAQEAAYFAAQEDGRASAQEEIEALKKALAIFQPVMRDMVDFAIGAKLSDDAVLHMSWHMPDIEVKKIREALELLDA